MPEPPDDISYVKEAFTWQYNLIALAGAAALALLARSEAPLVLAAGAELMYLATVPRMETFRRLARSWRYQDERKQHVAQLRQTLSQLPAEVQYKFQDLNAIAQSIRANYQRLSATSQVFIGSLETQLDSLLASYVRLAQAAVHHRDYIQQTNPALIRKEIDDLTARLPRESPKVQEINQKRIDILTKRMEKFGRIRENRQIIDAQCQAIQDVLHLIRDQSMTMSDPQQVSDRLEGLVKDAEATEQNIREVEAIFQMSPEAEPSLPEGSGFGTRDRQRN
jgi:chromosome segregation ATPase